MSVSKLGGGQEVGEERPWERRGVTSHWRTESPSRLDRHTHEMMSIDSHCCVCQNGFMLTRVPDKHSVDEDVGNSAFTHSWWDTCEAWLLWKTAWQVLKR